MKFILNKDKLTLEIEEKKEIHSGSKKYYEESIEFDESWNGLNIEGVLVEREGRAYADEGISLDMTPNNKVYVDSETSGSFGIGFRGYSIQYFLTEDTTIVADKNYYTRTGEEGSYIYTKVENPELESISTYYEALRDYQISSNFVDLFYKKGAGQIITQTKEIPSPSDWQVYTSQINRIVKNAQDVTEEMTEALEDVNTAIEETNNLDLDANKVNKTTTVTLTKKDNTSKVVQILDGLSLEFMWQGTSLGIRVEGQQNYVFVDLQGIQGPVGPQGEPFTIKKTYSSVAEMNADFDNMQLGDYVMIASTVEVEDNAKLYTRGETQWIYITDFSGATGIQRTNRSNTKYYNRNSNKWRYTKCNKKWNR